MGHSRFVISSGMVALFVAVSQPGHAEDRDFTERLHAGWVDIGIGHQDGRVDGFGRSDGLSGEGFRGLGGVRLDMRPEADDAEPYRVFLDGQHHPLSGLNYLELQFGPVGRHQTEIEFSELHSRQSPGQTPFHGAGSNELTLPDDWVAGTTTGDMDQLEDSLQRASYDSVRRAFRVAHERSLDARWDTGAEFRMERREGTRPVAAVMGSTGGNSRAALVPAPVEHTTREADLEVRYQQNSLHLHGGYRVSLYDNRQERLEWDNPYAQVGGWASGTGYPDGRGQLSLAPDNQFHMLHAGISNRLSDSLRFSGEISGGRMLQDEDLAPYTVNPALNVAEELPRTSSEGRVDILRLNSRLNWRPSDRSRVDLRYRGEDRNDRTPRAVFNYVAGDAVHQTEGRAHARARVNRPYSSTRHQLNADTALRREEGGQWFGGYAYDHHERELAEIGRSRENRVHAGLRRPLGDRQQVELRAEYGQRRVDDHDPTRPYRETHTAEYLASVDEEIRFENHPLMQRFNTADRNRQRASARWRIEATDDIEVSASVHATEDDFPDARLGLISARSTSVALDAGWFPDADYSLDAFLTHDRYSSSQNNRAFRGGGFKADDAFDPDRDWHMRAKDRAWVAGTGGNWYLDEARRTELTARVAKSWTDSRYDLRTGSALASSPIPDVNTRTRWLELGLRRDVSDRLDVSLDWYHERFQADDWAWDDVAPDTMPDVIASGQSLGRQSVQWISATLRWRFGG